MSDQGKAQEVPPPPQDKKKLYIIIGAVVGLIAIGGGAAFLMSGSGAKSAKGEAKVEEKAEEKGEGGQGAAAGGEVAAASGVYPLEPFIVNIYDGQEMRYLKLKVEFELANAQAKSELDAKVAPLRDAILILLTTKTMQEIQDLQGKNQLREQILGAVGKIISTGKVTKVYFTDFVVQ
jgi:flagellar protein FliL